MHFYIIVNSLMMDDRAYPTSDMIPLPTKYHDENDLFVLSVDKVLEDSDMIYLSFQWTRALKIQMAISCSLLWLLEAAVTIILEAAVTIT